jgi:hypothetical protein
VVDCVDDDDADGGAVSLVLVESDALMLAEIVTDAVPLGETVKDAVPLGETVNDAVWLAVSDVEVEMVGDADDDKLGVAV